MTARSVLPPDFYDCIGIFQGGGCRAAAYAGAYSAAVARGVNFSELAGTSAGAIAAVLIAAGAEPGWLDRTLRELDFQEFLSKPKGRRLSTAGGTHATQVWNLVWLNGVHDGKGIESWVEARLRELLPNVIGSRVRFEDLPKPVAVIAADLENKQPIVWSAAKHSTVSVAEAVRSSCTIPFFFQPHGPYVDGGVVSNLPLHIIENDESDRRRVLAFTLIDDDITERPQDVLSTALALAGTVTQGAQSLQTSLRDDEIDVIRIKCGDVKATDFDRMTNENVASLIEAGRVAVDEFFDAGVVAATPVKPSQVSKHLAQTLAAVASNFLGAQSNLLIAARDTKWVFELYSALLLARLRGLDVTVVLPYDGSSSPDVVQQRATLKALGCRVCQLPVGEQVDLQAFICDRGQHSASAVVLSKPELEIHARILTSADGDEDVINLLAGSLLSQCTNVDSSLEDVTLVRATDADVVNSLRTVRQYSTGQAIQVKSVEVEKIDAWARYAHVYKQVQQREMLRYLRRFEFDEFLPYFVRSSEGTQSLALPIVLEESPNGRCTVVNGLSRLLLLKRESRVTVMAAVVSGVTDQAPARGVVRLSDLSVRVGIRGDATHRYPGFVYQNVRAVERDAHTLRQVPDDEEGPTDG